MKHTKKILSKAMGVAKGTTMALGATVMLAVVLGVGTTALAANGKPFLLGKNNVATAVSTLTKQGPGPALRILVRPGQPPMSVNSAVKVANLNADTVDGKDSTSFLARNGKAADAAHADEADVADTATTAETATNADALGGMAASEFARGYDRIIVVSPAGSAAENGAALRSALSGITDASAEKPYLLKIEPGVYDVGTTALSMRRHVDIEGSGERVTRIAASGASGADANTIVGASDAELRFVTVENIGGGDYATAIRNDFASTAITHVTAVASGGRLGSRGIVNASASPEISETTVRATGEAGKKTGIQNYDSTLEISDTEVVVSGAGGEKRGIESNDGVGGTDTLTLSNVSVKVSEGNGEHHGITTFDYMLRATDVRVEVSGGGTNNGVSTRDGVGGFDLLSFHASKFFVSGGTNNNGILQNDTDMEISNTRIEAEGGTSIGLKVVEPGIGKASDSFVSSSVVRGAANTIQTSGSTNVRVGASRLHGGPASGVSACAGVHDENFAFFANTCP